MPEQYMEKPAGNEHLVPPDVQVVSSYHGTEVSELCDALESTMEDNILAFSIGNNRTSKPTREQLEAYWRGVVLVPERELIIGRVDGVIAAAIQLIKPLPGNQTSAFCGSLDGHFVAPWARGHGLAKALVSKAEFQAKKVGLTVLRLSVRSTMDAAIRLYESVGYKRWGVLDKYEMVDGKMVSGYFYYKDLGSDE